MLDAEIPDGFGRGGGASRAGALVVTLLLIDGLLAVDSGVTVDRMRGKKS